MLQDRVSSGSPSHAEPPSSEAGLRQVRVLVWVPPPHSAEHADHRSNSLHPAELRCCATIKIIPLGFYFIVGPASTLQADEISDTTISLEDEFIWMQL